MSAQARRYYERGKQALDSGDLETAQQDLASAVQLAPNFGNAICAYAVAAQTPGFEARVASGLARVYARLGRYRDMAQQLHRAAAISKAG
jgi:hypothetical protein